MKSITSVGETRSRTTTSAVILKCTCGDPQSHPQQVCPQARRVEIGDVETWHRRHPILWLKQLLFGSL